MHCCCHFETSRIVARQTGLSHFCSFFLTWRQRLVWLGYSSPFSWVSVWSHFHSWNAYSVLLTLKEGLELHTLPDICMGMHLHFQKVVAILKVLWPENIFLSVPDGTYGRSMSFGRWPSVASGHREKQTFAKVSKLCRCLFILTAVYFFLPPPPPSLWEYFSALYGLLQFLLSFVWRTNNGLHFPTSWQTVPRNLWECNGLTQQEWLVQLG